MGLRRLKSKKKNYQQIFSNSPLKLSDILVNGNIIMDDIFSGIES